MRPLALLFVVTAVSLMSSAALTPTTSSDPAMVSNYATAPLTFEPNIGQTASPVRFLARGDGYTIFLTAGGPVLALRRGHETAAVRMTWEGAAAQPTVTGVEPLASRSNYFVGKDPANWRVGVANYRRVKYAAIYPGVDAVYYGNRRQLEYDLVVAPAAQTGALRLRFEGAAGLRVDRSGDLILHTPAGDLVQRRPRAYQLVDGKRHAVAARYLVRGREVRLRLAAYDHSQPLVIDPVLSYSTFLGGNSADAAQAIAVDSSGDAYVTGATNSTNFPTTTGAYDRSCGTDGACNSGHDDVFVSKFTSGGSRLVYSTYIGGSSDDYGFGIAVDSSGNAYVAGQTTSPDFPAIQLGPASTASDYSQAFILKLNGTGSQLEYADQFSGSSIAWAFAVAVDSNGSAYVTGQTYSKDFPATPGAAQQTPGGGGDAFVVRMTPSGSGFDYATYLGGASADDDAFGIAVDPAGEVYVVGQTLSTDPWNSAQNNFPVTAGAFQRTMPAKGYAAFVTKLNSTGSTLEFSTYLGGSLGTNGRAIAIDSSGNAYVTGQTNSPDFPTTAGAFIHTCPSDPGATPNCSFTAFVTKVNASGSGLVYSTYLGGTAGGEVGYGISVDGSGHAYVGGETSATDFPTTMNAFQRAYAGRQDAFITELYATGTGVIFSSYLGGTRTDQINAVALHGSSVYVAGATISSNLPVTRGAFDMHLNRSSSGSTLDAFVARIVPSCAVSSANHTVTICHPDSGATVSSPVTVIAGSTDSTTVNKMQVYLDGTEVYSAPGLSAIDVHLAITAGTHTLKVRASDTAGAAFSKTETLTVH